MVQSLLNVFFMKMNFQIYRLHCDIFSILRRQRGHLKAAPHLLSFAKDVKLRFYTVPPGIEPRVVAWQSITQPLRHASSTIFSERAKYVSSPLQTLDKTPIYVVGLSSY